VGGRKKEERKKTLIRTFSREREKERAARVATFSNPLPLAGEGRVRVFLFSALAVLLAAGGLASASL